MALSSPQSERILLTNLHCAGVIGVKSTCCNASKGYASSSFSSVRSRVRCTTMAMEASPSLSSVDMKSIKWGSSCLQGRRDEMEDEVILRLDALDGFSFAAVLDGHGGVSSVNFLREDLFKSYVEVLQNGSQLSGKDFESLSKLLTDAFKGVDEKLLNKLETSTVEDESGSTATVMLIGCDMLYISHIGDSAMVLSRSGKANLLTDPHRPYGKNKSCAEEVKRIRNAGGWIMNGRVCGEIAVSRAFGDIRFKSKKNEMLQKGVEEGRWPQKFASRVKFNDDLVVATPDNFQVPLDAGAEFVLLATDGLWDYLNSSEAVAFVRKQFQQHGDVQIACEKLAQAALDRGSQDNISIIIADLGQTDWQSLPQQGGDSIFEQMRAFATVGAILFFIWMTSQLSLNL